MTYNFNGKNIKIDDAWLKNTMKSLELTKEEAIEMYLEDEGLLNNEEQIELQEKASKVRADHGASAVDKTKKRERKQVERIASDEKQELFQMLVSSLDKNKDHDKIDDFNIVKKDKLIMVQIGEKIFKLDLVETKTLNMKGEKIKK